MNPCDPTIGTRPELTCTADPEFSVRHEFHTFDLFGRRVNRAVCNEWCAVDASCQPAGSCGFEDAFARCKLEHTQYDYDGLSNQVLVERRGPYAQDICELGNVQNPTPYPIITSYNGGDRFLASYTYGPLGPISRTDEDPDGDTDSPQGDGDQYGDSSLANNRDYYYLRDATGGHVGVLYDHDADPLTPGQPAFSVYDSFGNKMTAADTGSGSHTWGTGSYAWRGGEGSVTDAEPNLIHMQARHYDPTLGRFIQADSLMLASFTTQGMNRYIYTENDPVNGSDPSGQLTLDQWAGIAMIVFSVVTFVIATASIIATVGAAGVAGLAVGWALWYSLILVSSYLGSAIGIMQGAAMLSSDPQQRCLLDTWSGRLKWVGVPSLLSVGGSNALEWILYIIDAGSQAYDWVAE